MDVDIDQLRGWIGRTESSADTVTATPIAALSATLDRADPFPRRGDPLPILWHWLYFLPLHRESEIGLDGHARRGGFLPPVPLPRRLYAGNRVEMVQPLAVGDAIVRGSAIVDVSRKEGRTGPLVFVRVRHQIHRDDRLAVTEDQDIVYRNNPGPDDPPPRVQRAPGDETWRREIHPDEVLLFRYSALTFNGYRIHYDRPFATVTQGYPGLVVHGPLIATLLADLVRRNLPNATISSFSFRAVHALFDTAPFFVCGRTDDDGRTATLWAEDADGVLAVEATATLNSESLTPNS